MHVCLTLIVELPHFKPAQFLLWMQYDIIVVYKSGFLRLSESAETWSTMANTSSSVEKCTRKALMLLWEEEIHLNTAVLAILSQEYWWEGVEATPTKHGLQLGLGRVQNFTYSASAGSRFGITGAVRSLKNRVFTQMAVSPPPGIR